MIYDTLEKAEAAQKSHFEKIKASHYANASDEEKKQLDSYYRVTNAIYDIRETVDGKFEYSEDGVLLTPEEITIDTSE